MYTALSMESMFNVIIYLHKHAARVVWSDYNHVSRWLLLSR